MRKIKKTICLGLAVLAAVLSACSSANSIKCVAPTNGETKVAIVNTELREFLSQKWTNDLCDRYHEDGWGHYEPCYIDFKWSGNADTFMLSKNADMSDAVRYECEGDSISIRGFNANTAYYWQVENAHGKSDVFTFTTEQTVRTVYIGGVTNSRDMGGWTVYDEDGEECGYIRQDLLFRSATLDDISAEGIEYLTNDLNVKTELDLRAETETHNRPIIGGVNYINISCPQYAYSGMGIFEFGNDKIENQTTAVKEIMSVFADENNYPINFHCAIGRDRTGTIAFLLGALCGMSEEDLCREYDISYFAGLDDSKPSWMHKQAFLPLVNKMKNYSGEKDSLAYNTRKYLLDIGLTQAQVDNIYNILVEKR